MPCQVKLPKCQGEMPIQTVKKQNIAKIMLNSGNGSKRQTVKEDEKGNSQKMC